jgi:DNA primase large subunit
MSNKRLIYLFHENCPKGEMFKLSDEEVEAKEKEGWVHSPARLKLPEDNDTGMTQEQVTNARPEDLVEMVKSFGFIVLTQEQLKGEANKMAQAAFDPANLTDETLQEELKRRITEDGFVALNLENVSDETLIGEAERRGLKQSDAEADELNELQDRFNEDPKSLNKEEHIVLGKSLGLSLRSNWGEDTMIEKITEALNAE